MLYVSSPIGLGHARRDLAIADELRQLRPGLEVTGWPSTRSPSCCAGAAELIHPASAFLASESGHIESEAAEHDLHAFQAVRRMDEILVSNFMVFADLAENEPFDLWVGDEAWDLDYFLHENPELKRAPVRLDDRLRGLAADAGRRRPRAGPDRRLQRGDDRADRPLPAAAGPGPVRRQPGRRGPGRVRRRPAAIRDWAERHYDFSGYVTGFDPAAFADRDALRAELGYRPGEQVCLVTVGGSGVGEDLLRRAVAAFPAAAAAGPRAADGRGDRAADRPGRRCPRPTASRCAATCTTCTGTWPRATWPWSRAG